MATGIRKKHLSGCPVRDGGARCRCDGKFEAWVYLPREGKKFYRSFNRESEAKAWRNEAQAEARRGKLRSPTKLTVEQAAWVWLERATAGAVRNRAGRSYKPSTLRGYRRTLRLQILPELGAHQLSELRRSDVQAFVDRLLGEGHAPGTIRNAVNPLQALYRHAMRRELVAVNPTRELELPSARNRPKRIASALEAAALLAALPASERALWATAFYAGLRRGELRALRWSDVDLGRSEIRVERSWDQYEGALDPKSDTSIRTVPILAVLRDNLDARKLATERDGSDLVFGRTRSEAFVPSTSDNRAKRAWKAAKLQRITLHECRHTFASLLIDAGVNAKALQTFMGHSTIQMTFDLYGHLMPGSREQARELVDRYIEAAVGEARVEAASADPCPSPAPVVTSEERLTAPEPESQRTTKPLD
jgi:integrase